MNTVLQWAAGTGIRLVVAAVLLIISFKIIKLVSRRLAKMLDAGRKIDATLSHMLINVVNLLLKCVIAISLVGYVGIEVTTISALIASVGVGAGLALNGALSNFAGSILLLVNRPFRIGDFIEAGDISGTVADIGVISTSLRTPDNRVIYLPNGTLSGANIVNYSEMEERRVDVNFSIAYEADPNRAIDALREVCMAHPLTLKSNDIFVRVTEYAESAVIVTIRVWTKAADYWQTRFDLLEQGREALTKAGISIPFNQLDVHICKD